MRYLIREKLFHLVEAETITDEQGQPVFFVEGQFLSIHHTLIVRDLGNAEVARVERQVIGLRPTYHITRDGVELAAVRKKLFSPFVERFTIDIPGPDDLSMTGSLLEHEFTVTRGDILVATISKAWVSLADRYVVDITPGEDDVLILASVLALELANKGGSAAETASWM